VTCHLSPVTSFVRLTHDGQLLAIAEPHGDVLKPTVVLPR
jgi:hypothetical protein